MSKDKFYFSHDCNARNDDKLIAVRMRHKAEGYGAYFMILEKLGESSDYMSVADYNIIAFDLRVSADLVKSIIEDFELFEFTEDRKKFYSKRFKEDVDKRKAKSAKNAESARSRWGKGANAIQTHSERTARKEKESKGEERKEEYNTPFIPPLVEEVEEYFDSKGYSRDAAQKFYAYYDENDWHDKNGKPIKRWRSKAVSVWFRPEHKKYTNDLGIPL